MVLIKILHREFKSLCQSLEFSKFSKGCHDPSAQTPQRQRQKYRIAPSLRHGSKKTPLTIVPILLSQIFEHFKQKQQVQQQGRQLQGTNFRLNNQYPKERMQRLKQLHLICKQMMQGKERKKEKKKRKGKKAVISMDTLYIDGYLYHNKVITPFALIFSSQHWLALFLPLWHISYTHTHTHTYTSHLYQFVYLRTKKPITILLFIIAILFHCTPQYLLWSALDFCLLSVVFFVCLFFCIFVCLLSFSSVFFTHTHIHPHTHAHTHKIMNTHNNNIWQSKMTALKFVTWNIRRVGSQAKQIQILSHLAKLQADICLLHETHLSESDHNKLNSSLFTHIFSANYTSKQRGVSILINKTIYFLIIPLWSTQEELTLGSCLNGTSRLNGTLHPTLCNRTPLHLINFYKPDQSEFI